MLLFDFNFNGTVKLNRKPIKKSGAEFGLKLIMEYKSKQIAKTE